MYSSVHEHIIKKVNETKVEEYPYPHIIIDNFFPDNLYKLLLKNKLSDDLLVSLKDQGRVGNDYSDSRTVLDIKPVIPKLTGELEDFWQNFAKYMHYHFYPLIMKTFKLSTSNTRVDFLYTRDRKNFTLGPHTDSINKVLTCLIYLPEDATHAKLGTSIYNPKDPSFKCHGGPHHKFQFFDLYKTIDYIPNRMFCFLKTDKSFHGVEPIDIEVERNLLIFDIKKL